MLFRSQLGKPGQNRGSNDPVNFWRVAKISIDPMANEAYISDGYGNKRVVVIDVNTGERKRYWGAYGNKPDDANLGNYNPDVPPAQQFRPSAVHCAEISNDNLLYVCDRANDRLQIFQKNGTFVKEKIVAKETRGGSVWDVAFSRDPQQTYMYLADGSNHTIHIFLRSTLEGHLQSLALFLCLFGEARDQLDTRLLRIELLVDQDDAALARDLWRGLRQLLSYDLDQIQTLYVTPHRWTPFFRIAKNRDRKSTRLNSSHRT